MTALSLLLIWVVGLVLGPDINRMLVVILCRDISQVDISQGPACVSLW